MRGLDPLSKILKWNSDPNSTRQLTEAAKQALTQLENAIKREQVHYIKVWQALDYLQNLLLQQYYGKWSTFMVDPQIMAPQPGAD